MYVGGSGLAGDRLLAFASGGAAVGKPLVSGAERTTMLRCRARFLSDGKHPSVEVTTPNQGTFRVDDPALIKALQRDLKRPQPMWLEQTEEPRMDCRPIALLSLQTVQRLTATSGYPLAADRFRVNILIDLGSAAGFREDEFAGRTMRIGDTVVLQIKERIPRCRVVTVDPSSGSRDPAVMSYLARHHEGRVGIYAAAAVPGILQVGDPIFVDG